MTDVLTDDKKKRERIEKALEQENAPADAKGKKGAKKGGKKKKR